MIPGNESSAQFSRRVRQILTAGEIGIRYTDNVGDEVEFRYLDASTPVEVRVSNTQPPTTVVVRRATNRSTLEVEYGHRIKAKWRDGVLLVTNVDVGDTAVEYDIVLGVER